MSGWVSVPPAGRETTGVGGFAKALRTIPVILEVARKVEQLAPEAFILNFTNPAGIVTEAVSRYSTAKIIGLCNADQHAAHDRRDVGRPSPK